MEVITDNQSTLAPRAGEAITRACEQYPDTSILLMFSGGSALSIIEHIDPTSFSDRATLSVLDERVGVSGEQSNMAQLEATDFFSSAVSGGAAVLDPRDVGEEGLEETATWFDTMLRAWQQKNPDGLVLITQGIGEDGHTAGILPFAEDPSLFARTFDRPDRFAVGYDVTADKSEFTRRVTVTLPFLRTAVTSSIVYAVGEKKQHALRSVMDDPDGPLAEVPARVIHSMNDVLFFSDQSL